jgi:hypothetical protein
MSYFNPLLGNAKPTKTWRWTKEEAVPAPLVVPGDKSWISRGHDVISTNGTYPWSLMTDVLAATLCQYEMTPIIVWDKCRHFISHLNQISIFQNYLVFKAKLDIKTHGKWNFIALYVPLLP